MRKLNWGPLFFIAVATCALAMPALGVVPAAEKLLPDDTLVLVTAPDFSKLKQACQRLPQVQCWQDPAMRPFREKFMDNWQTEFVQPLETELGLKFKSYFDLLQGQVTFAVTKNGWGGDPGQEPGLLLLIDTKDQAGLLRKNLAELRKKWTAAGRPLRTEKVRDVEFSIYSLSTNDVPKTWQKFFPKSPEVQELGDDKQASKPAPKTELVVGQVESLLIVGNALSAVEKVVAHLNGSSLPALADVDAYQADHQALFRDAPFYAWVNAKSFVDLLLKEAAQKKDNPDAPNPFDLKPEKVITALGLGSLKTVALTLQDAPEGESIQVFFAVPDSTRQGLFKILAGEPQETVAPAFVPADAVKFQRWRLDAQKSWATVQTMLSDISPQAVSALNFMLDSADANAKDKDPSFDIRKNLIGNLGNDIVSYEKAPRSGGGSDGSGPSLFLLGSPNPEQLAASLKSILVFVEQAGSAPAERDFLGRKIYTVRVGGMGMPMSGGAGGVPATSLSYAGSSRYLAVSTDIALLEEYLRSSENPPKPLRETPGLADAMQKVTGPGTSLFGYENDTETTRAMFEQLRKQPASTNNGSANISVNVSTSGVGLTGPASIFKQWADFSLLPPFDAVAKYFYFSVYGGSATTTGLTLKIFDPLPPALRGTEARR
jgi:hypothetical protein